MEKNVFDGGSQLPIPVEELLMSFGVQTGPDRSKSRVDLHRAVPGPGQPEAGGFQAEQADSGQAPLDDFLRW